MAKTIKTGIVTVARIETVEWRVRDRLVSKSDITWELFEEARKWAEGIAKAITLDDRSTFERVLGYAQELLSTIQVNGKSLSDLGYTQETLAEDLIWGGYGY